MIFVNYKFCSKKTRMDDANRNMLAHVPVFDFFLVFMS